MTAGDATHDLGQEAGDDRLRSADAQLADVRIGQKLDLLDALPDLIEHRCGAFDQRAAVQRRLNALRGAVEQANTERVFDLRHRLRHRGLRDRQLCRGLCHAAALRNRQQRIEIA